MADQHNPNGAYSEVFEEATDARQAQTIHRIRANSSIMQLKKLLGEFQAYTYPQTEFGEALNNLLTMWLGDFQWPIEEKFVSTFFGMRCSVMLLY